MELSAFTRPVVRHPGRSELTDRELRHTLGHFASGVTVITGHDLDGPIGFTCQSFTSLSMEPPLVSFSVMRRSSSYPRIRGTGTFCVNVLAHGQHDLSTRFARRGTDKWAGLDPATTSAGDPVLGGTLMWIDCRVQAEHVAGDHLIVIGEVAAVSPVDWHRGDPLVYFRGAYRGLRPRESRMRTWVMDA